MEFDLIVLGGGSGGLTAASKAAKRGLKVCLIEKEKMGGDCLWYGCVPTKTLISIAEKNWYHYQITNSNIKFDDVQKKVWEKISYFEKYDSAERFRKKGVDVIFGEPEILSNNCILVNNQRLIFKKLLIATGSSPVIPDGFSNFYNNTNILSSNIFACKMVIIGGGVVAIEYAQIFIRLGFEVTIIEMQNEILAREDKDICAFIREKLEMEGVKFILGSKVSKVEEFNTKRIYIEKDNETFFIETDAIFVAVGRKGNLPKGLENVGIKHTHGFIETDSYLGTGCENIFAIGDINGKMMFTHTASYEAEIALKNAFDNFNEKVNYEGIPYAIYTKPEIFRIGLKEDDTICRNPDIFVAKAFVKDVDRFVMEDELQGFFKIIIDSKGTLLGAAGIFEDSSQIAQMIVPYINDHRNIKELQNIVFPYPSKCEIIKKAIDIGVELCMLKK